MGIDPACELFYRCIQLHESDAWQEFIERDGPRIRRYLVQALWKAGVRRPSHADVEDLTQEFYCRLLTTGSRRFCGRTCDALWAYFRRTAANLVSDHLRYRRALKRRSSRNVDGSTATLEELAANDISPEMRLLLKEALDLFMERCGALDRAVRTPLGQQVLQRAWFEGWSSREIANDLEGMLTPPQIDRMLHRLRRGLARYGIDLPRRRSQRPVTRRPSRDKRDRRTPRRATHRAVASRRMVS